MKKKLRLSLVACRLSRENPKILPFLASARRLWPRLETPSCAPLAGTGRPAASPLRQPGCQRNEFPRPLALRPGLSTGLPLSRMKRHAGLPHGHFASQTCVHIEVRRRCAPVATRTWPGHKRRALSRLASMVKRRSQPAAVKLRTLEKLEKISGLFFARSTWHFRIARPSWGSASTRRNLLSGKGMGREPRSRPRRTSGPALARHPLFFANGRLLAWGCFRAAGLGVAVERRGGRPLDDLPLGMPAQEAIQRRASDDQRPLKGVSPL